MNSIQGTIFLRLSPKSPPLGNFYLFWRRLSREKLSGGAGGNKKGEEARNLYVRTIEGCLRGFLLTLHGGFSWVELGGATNGGFGGR